MAGDELILRGEVVADSNVAEVEQLRADNRRLRREVTIANGEIARAKAESARALSALRKQLAPLYQALQAVFGELDAASINDGPVATPTSSDPRVSAVWQSWKSRLGEGPAKVIDALVLHGDLNTQQLAIATGYHRTSISKLIYTLNKAGLLNKSGGRFSLKQL